MSPEDLNLAFNCSGTKIRYRNLGRGCIDFVTETGTHPSRVRGMEALLSLNEKMGNRVQYELTGLTQMNGADRCK